MEQKHVIPADNGWVEKNIRELAGSPVKRISDEWMLVTAGNVQADKGGYNTMTASWGGIGELWGKDVAFVFIRPQRHTFGFFNNNPLFTLSFFEPRFHKALEICGSQSGQDIDKAGETGITPIEFPDGSVGFKEASDIVVCKKLYTHDFDPTAFLDPSVEACYPQKDYHRMFIGEILSVKSHG